MPRYDYECQQCGKRFEVVQSMKDPKLEKCLDDVCNGRVKRLLGTGAGIIFKGSGFYQTDYRSSSYTEAAKADTGAAKGDAAAKSAPAAPAAAPASTPAPAAAPAAKSGD